jgi:hypothetical protein
MKLGIVSHHCLRSPQKIVPNSQIASIVERVGIKGENRKMKSQLWLCSGLVILMAGCGTRSSSGDQAQSSSPQPSEATAPAAQSLVKNPLLASSANQKVPAVPGLLQPTNAKARIPGISTGRTDPFSAVPGSAPVVFSNPRLARPKINSTVRASAKAAPASQTGTVTIAAVPPMPAIPPMSTLPSLPSVPVSGVAPLPPINIPVAPPMNSPTSLAEAIQVNGVVQVSGRWSVIVKEPNSSSSRYVGVGDYLENGKVLVKKIVASGTPQPTVVLQQNGVEIRKSLG